MFIHVLPSAEKLQRNDGDDDKKEDEFVDTKLQHVFIECDWFRQVGEDNMTGLRIVEYEPNWDGSKIVMLARCLPVSSVFWPVNPFSPVNSKAAVFDLKIQQVNVILYHESAA